jgi:hypothetical protein
MHLTGTQFMAENRQGLHLQQNLGDAFADVCRRALGRTPKVLAKEINADIRTARNVLDGRAGAPMITRALQVRQRVADDHYDIFLALGFLIFGETLDAYEERKLLRIIESTENARRLADARRARRGKLRDRATSHSGGVAQRSA